MLSAPDETAPQVAAALRRFLERPVGKPGHGDTR
jgi:hypothetical protein